MIKEAEQNRKLEAKMTEQARRKLKERRWNDQLKCVSV